jgi:histone H3/H4
MASHKTAVLVLDPEPLARMARELGAPRHWDDAAFLSLQHDLEAYLTKVIKLAQRHAVKNRHADVTGQDVLRP